MPAGLFPRGAVVTVSSPRPDSAGQVKVQTGVFPDGGVIAVWSASTATALDRVLMRFRVELRDADDREAYDELVQFHTQVLQAAPVAAGVAIDSYGDDEAERQSECVTVSDAAELAGVTPSAIRQARERGVITGRQVGRIWLLDRHSVEAYRRTR